MATSYQNRLYGHAWFAMTANTTIAITDAVVQAQAFTASATASNNTLTAVSNTSGIAVGQIIYCPANMYSNGTTVVSVNTSTNTVVTSSNFTGSTGTGVSMFTSQEGVTNLSISKIISSGPWSIYRNSTNVWNTSNTNQTFDFVGHGTALSSNSNQTIVCNTASTTASLLIQVSKQSYANGTTI
jgi:hypothetical protein